MRRHASLGPLAALVLVLTGCSGGDDGGDAEATTTQAPAMSQTEKEWRADLEQELGRDDFDFDAAVGRATEDCQRTEGDAWRAHLALSGSLDSVPTTRIGLEHACPEVVKTFDGAVDELEGVDDFSTYVCTLPTDGLAMEQLATLQMVCGG
ncbi:MAG: hypothetical protein ACI379_08440 [Nocardioides sp.]|uniref:hypothetical protein n=1 Tax=Nocardioides sp. TaxID=35761 RepID=UPI003EFC9205